MRRHIVTEIALSPLGDKRILSCEPAFEAPLRAESGIQQGYRPFSHLGQRQIKAIERLVGFYEATSRFNDAGHLSVMLATRQHNVNLSGPTLDARLKCLRQAQKFFDLSGKRPNIQSIVQQILVQRETLNIVSDRYADYDKDTEDEQILALLNVSILSKSELREMALCWLEDDDAETRAAFKKSKEFSVRSPVLSRPLRDERCACRTWRVCWRRSRESSIAVQSERQCVLRAPDGPGYFIGDKSVCSKRDLCFCAENRHRDPLRTKRADWNKQGDACRPQHASEIKQLRHARRQLQMDPKPPTIPRTTVRTVGLQDCWQPKGGRSDGQSFAMTFDRRSVPSRRRCLMLRLSWRRTSFTLSFR